MLERYEYLRGTVKVERHWWIGTKLAILTVVTSLVTIGLLSIA